MKQKLSKLTKLHKSESLRKSRFSRANLVIFAIIFASIGGYLIYSSFAAGSCSGTVLNPSNISTTVSGAAAGTIFCLNDGNYSLTLSGVSKSSDVIIRSVNSKGANFTNGIDITSSNHFVLDNLTIAGGYLGQNKNTAVKNSAFTDYFRVDGTSAGNDNVLIDSNTFTNISLGNGYEGRLSLGGGGGTGGQPVGITVSNNHFYGGNNTDGIFITNGTYGAQIGPGNEFDHIVNAGGGHIDALQLYGGGAHTLITGNYFHENSSGIMACDGNADSVTIKNNVFANTDYNAVCAAHMTNLLIEHNTIYNNGNFRIDDAVNPQSSTTPTTAIVRNNIGAIETGGCNCGGTPPYYGSLTQANNLYSGASSPNINGTPIYTGGANPTTQTGIAGFALASGSPGKNAATDGQDVGTNFYGPIGPQTLTCSVTLSSGASISSAVSAASGGDTICLGDGVYSGVTLSNVNKSSMVTIKSINGAANVDVGQINWSNVSNIKLDGVTFSGRGTSNAITGSHDIQIINSIGKTQILVVNATIANANILFDHNQHLDIPNPCDNNACVEGMISVVGSASPSGVTIQNSFFSGGTADGVQIGANQVKVLNNEFTGIITADPHHNDPVQIYGGTGTTISGNYFHNDDTGIMAPDGETNPTITNNVFVQTGYPYAIVVGSWNGGLISHNTFKYGTSCAWNSCGTLWLRSSTGVVVKDNIIGEWKLDSGSATEDYNLVNIGMVAHGHTITGLPTYTGGANPATWAGYALTPASKGYHAASDGLDMGATSFGSTSSLMPTVSLTANPTSVNSGSASTLSWSSTNAASCTASGDWSGSKATNGTQSTGNLTAAKNYTLTCTGDGGTAQSTATVSINSPQFTCSGTHTICEDFSSGASNFTTTNGTWTVNGGKYNLTNAVEVAGNIGIDNRAVHNTNVNGDFTLTIDGSVVSSSGTFDDFGVIFDYQDANNYYAAQFNETNADGTNGLLKVQNGVETEIADFTSTIAAGTTYAIKVEKIGSTIKITRGGTLLATTTDTSFTNGKVGFGSSNDSATFDSLVVDAAPTGPKPGDINNDNNVNITDLSLLLSSYNQNTTNCITNNTYTCDLSTPPDNVVNIFDLSILLSHYGT
jgi:hypothetical protein